MCHYHLENRIILKAGQIIPRFSSNCSLHSNKPAKMLRTALCVILFFAIKFHISNCFEIQPRIINGFPSKRGQFTFYVHIDIKQRFHTNDMSTCGGALVSERFVLTAAHCIFSATKIALYMGTLRINEREDGRQYFFVKRRQFYIHPQFEPDTLRNDIALIKLRDRVVFSYFVQPIAFTSSCDIPVGMNLTIAGNGFMIPDGMPAEILQFTTLTTTSYRECDDHYNIVDRNSIFCVKGDKNSTHSSSICQGNYCPKGCCEANGNNKRKISGDSGGALIDETKKEIYGIASFTEDGNGCQGMQGFTNVIYYLPWISYITGIKISTDCD